MLPENQLILQKTVKKYHRDRFLRKCMVPGGAHNLDFTCVVARNGFRSFTPLLKLFQMI